MPQVKVHELCLALHAFDLSDEVVVEIELAQLSVSGQALDLFDLVEAQNEREQVRQALDALNSFDLVVEQVKVDNALDVAFAAHSTNQVFGHEGQDGAHRDLWGHRVFNGSRPRVLIELILVVHQLLDMARDHEVMQRALQAAHVTPVQVLSRQVDI